MAPRDGILDFLIQSQANGNTTAGLLSDMVFADWLEDHDDSRHWIIRSDLTVREKGKSWYTSLLIATEEMAGDGYNIDEADKFIVRGNEESISYAVVSNPTPICYQVYWVPRSRVNASYVGLLNEEQLQQIISQFGG